MNCKYDLVKNNADYERGFIDGMQEQMQRSVDKAVNAMANSVQREWQGLTNEEIKLFWSQSLADTEGETYLPLPEFARAIEAK